MSLNSLLLAWAYCLVLLWYQTWYTKNSVPFTQIGYKSFVLNRSKCKGDGAMLLTKTGLNGSVVEEFSISNADFKVLSVGSRSNIFMFSLLHSGQQMHPLPCW